MKEYRISKSRSEIVKKLESKFKLSESFTMWQKDIDGKRVLVIETFLLEFNQHEGFFNLKISDEDLKKADLKAEFYFLLNGHDLVFKTKLSRDQEKGAPLRFLIPKDVRLEELRNHPRKYFEAEDRQKVKVVFQSNNSDDSIDILSDCLVLNISKGGICVLVSKETFLKLDSTKAVTIEGIDFFEGIENTKKNGYIRNARLEKKKGITKDDFYAIGIEFI